jgi:hypothetical protein
LRVNELQDLAERLDAVKRAAAGVTIRFIVRIELGDGGIPVAESTVERVNQVLGEVPGGLKLSS